MIEVKKDIEILEAWNNLNIPRPGKRMMFQFANTNLWILKTSKNKFGFLISDTMGILKYNYKNIYTEWKESITNYENNIKLKKCLVIESKENIDSRLFCSAISSLFENQKINHLFGIDEIENALRKIEEITLKEADEFNEVVGVWGELFLMNELIKITISEKSKLEIIESWEGVETRSIIDFNFKSRKTKIEVKTTTEPIRIHHLNGLDQVSIESNYKGFLASFCINPDDEGITCNDLVNNIKKNIPKIYLSVFENKLTIRGHVCYNTKHQFVINSSKELQFFDFNRVPKPIIEDGVGKIEWDAVLENKEFLDINDKDNLLNLMN